jgi:hypothetical protein
VLRLRDETDLTLGTLVLETLDLDTLDLDTGFLEIVSAPTNRRLVITKLTKNNKAKIIFFYPTSILIDKF